MGLDIGTSRVKALAARFRADSKDLEILGKASAPSFGVRKGVVMEPERVAEIASSVLREVRKETGREPEDVFVSLGGNHVFSTVSEGAVAISRADGVVSEEDVSRVVDAAKTFSLGQNREILRVFPQEFKVDEEESVREAVGMKGVRLEAKILVIACFTPYLENLSQAVLDSGTDIGYIMSKPLATAESVLAPRERELGVLVVDIGAGTTSFAAFKEKAVLKVGIVPVGSFNITKDLGMGLKTDVDTAERIKLEHGSCFLSGKEKAEVESEALEEKVSFSHSELGKIIDPRVEEIFSLVKKELGDLASAEFAGGVILTGGGARLPGVAEMAKETLGFATRVSGPAGFLPEQEDPSLSTVCGLVKKAGEFAQKEESLFQKAGKKMKRSLRDLIP